jgi:hypothetical protein
MRRSCPLLLVGLLLLALLPRPWVQAEGNDFRLLLLPSTVELSANSSASVTLILLGEGQSTISLAINQLPAGLSATIGPPTLTMPGISILTLSTAPPFVPGLYALEITASDGNQLKAVTLAISSKKSLELKPARPYTYTWPTGTATLDFFLYDDSSTIGLTLSLDSTQTVSYTFAHPLAMAAETYRSTLSISPGFSNPGLYPMTAKAGSGLDSAQAPFSFVLLFLDTRNHWASSAIAQLLAGGILAGYPDGTFRPENPLTRAEMAKILSLSFDLPLVRSATLPFNDLEASSWATPYIERLWKGKIVEGFPDGGFHPSAPVTRAELAAMLNRVFSWPPIPANYSPTFTDLDSSSWAFVPVESGAWQGVWDGYPDGSFRPSAPATRAEVSALVARLILNP